MSMIETGVVAVNRIPKNYTLWYQTYIYGVHLEVGRAYIFRVRGSVNTNFCSFYAQNVKIGAYF
jgi:hypothetical protein